MGGRIISMENSSDNMGKRINMETQGPNACPAGTERVLKYKM